MKSNDATLLVTGAAGAIGSEVAEHAAAVGWRVVGLGHGTPKNPPASGWLNGEVNAENLNTLFAGTTRPAAIIHLAGGAAVGPSISSPAEDFRRTVGAALNLLDWVRQISPLTPIVFASSAAIYGNSAFAQVNEQAPTTPASPYGYHKAIMEQLACSYAATFGIRSTVLRLFSVYGSTLHKQLIWELCRRLERGERRLLLGGTGEEKRDWLHISDAARMLLSCISHAKSEGGPMILNGCTGVGTTVAETVDLIITGAGIDAEVEFSGSIRKGDPFHLVGDPKRAAELRIEATIAAASGIPATARTLTQSGNLL